jgi:predicted dehydrogenase
MLAEQEPELACVITRTDQHCEMTCRCLAAGANVLVTKPWAVNEAEARRMVSAEAAANGRILPWLPARWGCVFRRLRELLADGVIGRPFLIRRAVGSFGTRCDWQTERRYGGGYLLNWGAHILDPPVLLTEQPVAGVYGRLLPTINPGAVEDVLLAILTLADGTLVQAEYTITVPPLPEWFIQGDGGTIEVHGQDITAHRQQPRRPDDPTHYATMRAAEAEVIEEHVDGHVDGDEAEIYAEVATALRGDRPFAVTSADALELTRVLDAVRASSEQNRVVDLTAEQA